jgi:hypothetical protein
MALQLDGEPPHPLPATCDFTLDDLLTVPPRDLLARLQD